MTRGQWRKRLGTAAGGTAGGRRRSPGAETARRGFRAGRAAKALDDGGRIMVLAKVLSSTLLGVDAHPVDVEVALAMGLPVSTTVGLPDAAVRDSRDRVKAAMANCGFPFPSRRVTVNLARTIADLAGADDIAIGHLSEAVQYRTLDRQPA